MVDGRPAPCSSQETQLRNINYQTTAAHLVCKDLLSYKELGQICEEKVTAVEMMMKVMMMVIAGNSN